VPPSHSSFAACLADLIDPHPRDTFHLLDYRPHPGPQSLFHQAGEYEVVYGGALGGGKTKALAMEAIRVCDRHPGLTAAVFRRTYPELEDSFIKELAAVGFARHLGCRWEKTRRNLHFPNGSMLSCRYAETIADATRYQGAEYQWLGIDELTLMPADVVEFLLSRVRSGKTAVPVLGFRGSCNPGGIAHTAVKDRYVEPTGYGQTIIVDPNTGQTRRFIPAKSTDNPSLDDTYRQRLNNLPEPLRSAFRDGNWDTFAGQVFLEWSRDLHVVPPFDIPAGWRKLAGIDWGYAAPWAVEWAAVDPDKRVWIYRELYDVGVLEADQARRIVAAEHGEQVRRYADPSMWADNRHEGIHPIAHVYNMHGAVLAKADNDRIAGVQRTHSYLAPSPACRYHRQQGLDMCPRLHVLDGRAPNLVRTLPGLPADPLKPEDVDTSAEDHAYDALRYLLMALPVPTPPKAPEPVPSVQDRIWAQIGARHRPQRHPVLGR
jgi:hypothetical protein